MILGLLSQLWCYGKIRVQSWGGGQPRKMLPKNHPNPHLAMRAEPRAADLAFHIKCSLL